MSSRILYLESFSGFSVPDNRLVDWRKLKSVVSSGAMFHSEMRGFFRKHVEDWRYFVDLATRSGSWRLDASEERESLRLDVFGYSHSVLLRDAPRIFSQSWHFEAYGFRWREKDLVMVYPSTMYEAGHCGSYYYKASPVSGVADNKTGHVCEVDRYWGSDRWCEYSAVDVPMLELFGRVSYCQMHGPIYLIHKSEVNEVM